MTHVGMSSPLHLTGTSRENTDVNLCDILCFVFVGLMF
jgi:hypothetical protein